jgi:hypothetical protein
VCSWKFGVLLTVSIIIKYAVNPARLVSAQAFSLVANGNVVSGAATAMQQLQSGSFIFETRRPSVCVARVFAFSQRLQEQKQTPSASDITLFSLPQVQQRPNTCSIQASAPYKPGKILQLQPQLAAQNALSRLHVALAMVLGAPMQVRTEFFCSDASVAV